MFSTMMKSFLQPIPHSAVMRQQVVCLSVRHTDRQLTVNDRSLHSIAW